jgi:hypothetical protein
MRFSIRDLLWATVVMAVGLGWWASYQAINAKRLEAIGQAHRMQLTLKRARIAHERLDAEIPWATMQKAADRWYVDWSVLDEPLVEP